MISLTEINKRINEEFSNYPIIKYLKIIQPSWTKIFAMKMIRKKQVIVNDKKVQINYRLRQGDRIKVIGINSKSNNAKINVSKLPPLKVVFEDKNIIIVDKEVGIDVQRNSTNHSYNNMNNRLLNHLNWNDGNWKPVFVHRLDYNTSGLLIGAKNYRSCTELEQAFKDQKIDKYYKAIVSGLVNFKHLTIKNHLLKKDKKVYVVDKSTKNSKEAISEVSLIKHDFQNSNSLLEVKIVTGRTHQIRVQLSNIGHPIRGDQKYGVEKDKKTYKYPQLVAYKLKFSENMSGESIGELRGKEFEIKTDI